MGEGNQKRKAKKEGERKENEGNGKKWMGREVATEQERKGGDQRGVGGGEAHKVTIHLYYQSDSL